MVQHALLLIYMVPPPPPTTEVNESRVGEVYARHQNGLPSSEDEGDSDITDTVGHIARIGSMALVVFSCVTVVSSILLPPFVRKPDDERKYSLEETDEDSQQSRITRIWHQTRIPVLFTWLVVKARPVRPPLTIAWAFGHGLFAFAMFCAPFVSTVAGATFVVGLCGLPWAVTCWAPIALLGDEIAKMGRTEDGYEMVETNIERRSPPPSYDQISKERPSTDIESPSNPEDPSTSTPAQHRRDSLDSVLSSTHSEDLEIFNDDPHRSSSDRILRLGPRASDIHSRPPLRHDPAPTNDVAGEMLGIMNVFVTLPQFIMTFVSSIVFAILEPGKSTELTEGKVGVGRTGVSAIAVVMVIGGVGSLVAGWWTLKLRKL
jgi:solute carrier family 45 protein 1/2/4